MDFLNHIFRGAGPVWTTSTDEVVISPNNSAEEVTVPAGCIGMYFSNTNGSDAAFITPDNADLDSGIEVRPNTGVFIGIQGSPTFYCAKPGVGAVAVNCVRFYAP